MKKNEEFLKKDINKGEQEKNSAINPTATPEPADTNNETIDEGILHEPEVTSVWVNMVAKKRVDKETPRAEGFSNIDNERRP